MRIKKYFYKEVAEWSKAIDCKSIELCSTLVRNQPSLEITYNQAIL